jgi:hypothetical protein
MRTISSHLLAIVCLLSASTLAFAAAPVAVDDLLLVAAGSSVTTDYLLANDSDADGDALNMTSYTQPQHGALAAGDDSALTYTPADGYTGDDSFSYDVSDGQTTASATVTISVNAPFDPEAARDALLAGVDSLADPTQPGRMVAWGPTAYSVTNYPGEDERDPMVTAATMGAGRVIAMPDHQWANMDSHGSDPSTGTFYLNAVAWLTETSSTAIKVVTLNASAASWLPSQGFTNVVETDASGLSAELADAELLVTWLGSNPSQELIDTVVSFTKAGGALLFCDYGPGYQWWWNKEGPDIPGNRALRHAGIGFTGEWPMSGVQTINRASDQVTDDDVVAVYEDPAAYTAAEADRAAVVFTRINDSLPTGDTLKARLAQVFESKLDSLVPTPEAPVTGSLDKAILNQEGQQLQDVPVDEMTAHRAALPVDPDAPRIATTVTLVEPDSGHAKLVIDTGLYAAPGEVIDVTVPEALAGLGLQIQIGHLRTDTDDAEYFVMPYQQLVFEVDSATLQVASPHGGLLMFVAPGDVEWTGDQSVQVDGAVEAPYFVLGEHTDADWIDGVRDRGTPFGVLKCASTVLIIESEQFLRTLDDPEAVMAVYEPLIAEIAGLYDYDRGRELRIHHDYQPAGGVSAFPLSYNVTHDLTDSHKLTITGEPLTMHEHGHHADSGQIIFGEFGETSPNLGGKYAQQVLSSFAWKQELPVGRINNYAFTQTDDLWNHYNHYKVDVKGTPFDCVAAVFGWEALKNIVHTITNLPSEDADTDQESLDQWLIQIGAEVGHDVSPFLELWQMSFSETALAAVADLPDWSMVETVREDLVMARDTSASFANPIANDFSYDGTLDLLGLSDPAQGSLVDQGNDTWTYTPAVGFVGKDVITYTVANATNNTFTGTISITVTEPEALPAMEVGGVHVGTSSWTTVTLDTVFSSPVVIAQPAARAGSPPLVSRVRHAEGNSFEVMLQRADGASGAIEDVDVQFLVVEEGIYNVADHGIKMEAARVGSSTTDTAGDFVGQPVVLAHDWEDHYFIPVMLGQVMSYNDDRWSAFWADGSALGYTIGKHVGEDSDADRADETLGYLVMEAGSLQIGGVRIQAGGLNYDAYAGLKAVSSGGSAHTFSHMPPLSGAIVQAQGLDDSEEGYWTVLDSQVGNGNRISARLVEDTIGDADQGHGDLGGSYLLFSDFTGGVTAIDDVVTGIGDTLNLVAVLDNDVSNFGADLWVASVTEPMSGTVTQNEDGTLTYVPSLGFAGTDRFYYEVTDGTVTDTGLVWIEVGAPVAVEVGVLMETWFDITGGSVSDLTASPSFPDSPDASEVRSSWEAPVNRADQFGTRMVAHLLPPESGDYTFWIASDDGSQLLLSSDRTSVNASQIASVSGWTSSQQWDKSASQQSTTITLEAGAAYYMEALHKEGGGGDNLAVAWAGPGFSQEIIDGQYLRTVGLNAPTVAEPISDVTVEEGAADSVIDVSGVFVDADPADPISLAVHANTNPPLVALSLIDGELVVSYAPDAHGTAEVTVRATDAGGAMATDSFTVTVTPVGFPPVVDDATFSVAEGSPLEAAVGQVEAFDPDPEDALSFEITDGDTGEAFDIDPDTGAITVSGALDFEALAEYVLEVTVSDDGDPPSSAAASVTITLIDVNEAPTVSLSNQTTSLPEDAVTTPRLKVADVTVIDDALGSETLSLTGADVALFELDGAELYLKAGTALDFETQPTLEVAVAVDDPTLGDGADDVALLAVTVTWVDVDECLDSPCAPDAVCTDTSAAFECACNSGYTGDGMTCADIDECLDSPCDVNATCANSAGSFSCTCHDDYTGDGATCAFACATADCDDANPCTGDGCSTSTGCTHTPLGSDVACDDGDACTAGLCGDGVCVSEAIAGCCVAAEDCDDGDACTADLCEDGACASSVIAGCCVAAEDCDDGDDCTADLCEAGACASSAIDGCCVAAEDCDDDDACTEDLCEDGACASSAIAGCCVAAEDCDDADPCTVETCPEPGGLCAYVAVDDCCSTDGDCEPTEPCQTSTCPEPGEACLEAPVDGCCIEDADCTSISLCSVASCDLDLGMCELEAVPECCVEDLACDDGDPCTDDVCAVDTGECANTPIQGCCVDDASCEDDDPCTTDLCSEESGTCENTPQGPGCCVDDASCDDGDPCTEDACSAPGGECISAPLAGCCQGASECDDANPCTEDSCDASACVYAPIQGCCAADEECQAPDLCQVGSCGSDGLCAFEAVDGCCLDDVDCDDADACTVDTCSEPGGTCARLPIEGCCPEGSECGEPEVEDETDPGTTDPGTTDPGTTDPGTTDPGTTDAATGCASGASSPFGGWLTVLGLVLWLAWGRRRKVALIPQG